MNKYCGLNNLGNTCYMNSLLQTLFMTREFREALFKWKYDAQKHPDKEDCIPYQLQLLFARMQETDQKCTDAKGLIKSFQWDPQESFAQHDVQEFCRVLFDAIQQSCSEEEEFINSLYQLQVESFVKCKECKNESIRNDTQQDVSLTVRSDFMNVYNESIEKALKFYLQPEILDQNNLYNCTICDKKVEAIKGLRFKQLPEILTIQLNRFDLDLNTFERKKINDYVSYPFILNMNNFLQDYDKIQIIEQTDLLLEREKLKQQYQEEKAIRGCIDDPLKRNRAINRKPSPGDQVKKVHFVEEPFQIPEAVKQHQNAKLREAQEQLDQAMKCKKLDKPQQFISSKIPNDPNLILTADEAYDLDDDMLFGKHEDLAEVGDEMIEMNDVGQSKGINSIHQTREVTGSVGKQQFHNIDDSEKEIINQIQEESHEASNQDEIKKYLQQGPFVYELYAIMIHSGGALGGHYYSYIKSFEDVRWYSFNDTQVESIRWNQILSMYGDKYPKYNSGVSAYFLMYRKVGTSFKSPRPQLSPWVKSALDEENEIIKLREEKEMHLRREKDLELLVKCFYKDKNTMIAIKKDQSLREFKQKIINTFQVPEDWDNTRVRFYSQIEDMPQETFTGKDDFPLQELHFTAYKSVLLEVKQSHEKFSDYDPHLVQLRVYVWRDEDTDVSTMIPIKIQIHDDKLISELEEMISQKTGIPSHKLLILQKPILNTGQYSIVLNQNKTTQIMQLPIGKCAAVYVEEYNEENERALWDIKFENDKHKCVILFNDPRKQTNPFETPDYSFEMHYDSRKTLQELKESMADFLGLQLDSFILKKSSRISVEFKDLTTSIKDNSIIGRGTITLAMGKPSIKGLYKAKISLGQLIENDNDSISFDFTDLLDMQINAQWTVSELKEKISQEVTTITLSPDLMRLRLKALTKLSQVYKDQDLLKSYRLFDNMNIVVELIKEKENIEADDLLTYVKYFDMKNFTLSKPYEIFVKQTQTLDQLSLKISQALNIDRDVIEGIKINNISCFALTDLVTASFDWLQLRFNQMELGKQPWYVIKDSNFIIVRDVRDVPDDLSALRQKCDEIISKSSDPIVQNKLMAPVVSTVNSSKPKEKALKITVKKKQDPIQQQQEQQQKAEQQQNASQDNQKEEHEKREEQQKQD